MLLEQRIVIDKDWEEIEFERESNRWQQASFCMQLNETKENIRLPPVVIKFLWLDVIVKSRYYKFQLKALGASFIMPDSNASSLWLDIMLMLVKSMTIVA